MRKFLRSTRRGWMIFSEADKGGKAGGGAAVIDAPEPKPAGISPTDVFKQARVDAGLDQPPEPTQPTPPTKEEPAAAPAKEEPAKPAKSVVPEDVIEPGKTEPVVPEAIAEIRSMVLPKNAKPEQVANFEKLKSKAEAGIQAALDRAAELEAKINKGDSTKAELDTLREQLTAAQTRAAEIEEKWSKEAYASSPKFQAQFAGREQTALDLAKSYLDGTEVKQDIIDLAAHATGRKRVELLKDAGIDDATIQLISPHLANYDTVQREKQSALANWKQDATRAQQEHAQLTEKAQAARAELENKVWDQTLTKVDLLPLRKSKDNPEWNGRAEQIVAEAKKIFNGDGADLPTFAETILKGKAYDAQQEVVDHLKTELANARAENAKLKSAAPGGAIGAGTQDRARPDTTKMSRDEVAKSTFNEQKAKVGAA